MSRGNRIYRTMFKMAGDQNITIPRAPCHWTPLALAVDPFTEKHKSNPQLVLAERPGKCGIYLQRSSRYVLVSVTRVFTCLLLLHARDGCSKSGIHNPRTMDTTHPWPVRNQATQQEMSGGK